MRVILDTGLFFRPDKLDELRGDERDVIVPAVAYQERLRQLHRRGQTAGELDQVLFLLQFDVEPFTPIEAHRRLAKVGALDDAQWKRLARDAMIAGHVRPGDELWTTNPSDFLDVGVPAHQIVAVPAP